MEKCIFVRIAKVDKSMFPPNTDLNQINALGQGNMFEYLGIEITEVGTEFLKGKMPVDERTKQPLGLLHGGASVALAETLGSVASTLLLDLSKQFPVGLAINANHIKSARQGFVHGICSAIHLGRKTHVWEIRITNDEDELVCISRLTVAVLDHKH